MRGCGHGAAAGESSTDRIRESGWGFLYPRANVDAFRRGLRDLGYVEGKNIVIEFRFAEGERDRIPILVAELVRLKVDVLVSGDSSTIQAAKRATKTIPIVMVINKIRLQADWSTAWRGRVGISRGSAGLPES